MGESLQERRVAGVRVAYADPPYPGKASYYKGHEDYAGEVDHAALIERLEAEYPDGWALSSSMDALARVLPLCPQPVSRGARGGGVIHQFRVLVYAKRNGRSALAGGPLYAWEPVILRGCRKKLGSGRPLDWLESNPPKYGPGRKPPGHVIGAKPIDFSFWLFRCMGLERGDELVDLFPGSGGVQAAWERWTAQHTLMP